MIDIKKYLSVILSVVILLLSSCSFKNDVEPENEEAELIINENNSVFKFVAEDTGAFLPTKNISKSLAEALGAVYEPLYDFDGAGNKIPVLASGCVRSGKYQYKVDLKDGVLWHDGSELVATDVIYTVNELKKNESVYSPLVEKITGVDVITGHKLLFTLGEPTVNFEALLTFPIVKRNATDEKDPVGTGAYRFKERKGNTCVFEKNEKWHMGEAGDKKIEITLLKDKQSAVYAFEAGEADVISTSLIDLTESTPKGKSSVIEYISNKLTFLGFNTSEGLLSLAEVRRAVSYLIDKNEIIERDAYGRGEAADVPIHPKAWFYSAGEVEISSDGNYLESVLNDNEWYKSGDKYYKSFDGRRTELVFSILVNSENEEKVRIAEDIAGMLEKAGLTVKVKALAYDKYAAKVNEGDFSMFIGEIALKPNMDPSDLLKSGKNYFLYSSGENDAVLQKLTSAETAEEIQNAYGEFCGVFSKEMPFVPIFFRKEAMVCNSALSGFAEPNYFKTYGNIENWYFSKKVELNG